MGGEQQEVAPAAGPAMRAPRADSRELCFYHQASGLVRLLRTAARYGDQASSANLLIDY